MGLFPGGPSRGGAQPPTQPQRRWKPPAFVQGGGTFRAPAIIRLAGRNFSIGLEFFGKLALCPGNAGCLRKTWSVATPPRDFFLVVTGIWLSGSFSFQGFFPKIAPERSFPELKVSKSFSNFPGKFPGNPDFWAATPQFFPGSDRPGQFHALLPVLASRREINFCCSHFWQHPFPNGLTTKRRKPKRWLLHRLKQKKLLYFRKKIPLTCSKITAWGIF